jgi:uncharacterized membrane protein
MAKANQNPTKSHRDWRRPQFWRNLFLYFWVFSLVGHIVEIIFAILSHLAGVRVVPIDTIPIVALAVPYGLGAVVLLVFLYPWFQKKRINLFVAFVLGAFLTTVVEFICAALLVIFVGHNPFWNYSHRFANLFGFVCLGNSLMFGLAAIIALKWVFPFTEKLLDSIKPRCLNVAFWILFVGYILSQIYLRIIRG